MKRIFIFLLVAVFSLNVYAQEKDLRSMMKERNEFYFSFEIDDLQDIAKIAKMISIDNVDGNKITAYANNKQYKIN